MTEIFETYSKRNYYNTLFLFNGIIFFAFIISGLFFPELLSKLPQKLMIIIFLISLGILFLGAFNLKQTYTVNGELKLSLETITYNDKIFSLNPSIMIEISGGNYNGQVIRGGIHDGTNAIKVFTTNHNCFKTKFIISSEEQRDNTILLLKAWRRNGFKVSLISNYVDLL